MRMRLNIIRGCIAFLHTLYFSCKNIASYLREYNADCNLWEACSSTVVFLVSRNAAMCIDHCTFWQQYWMSITHCMLCRNLMFWKTYCMIEGRLNITMKGRKTTLLQKGTLHVWRTPWYFVGILFLERSNALPWRKIAADEWKVYDEMKTSAKATLYLVDECLIVHGCLKGCIAAVSKWFGLLACSNLSIPFPLHRLFVFFTVFLAGGIFIWMNILAETSGMMMCMKN